MSEYNKPMTGIPVVDKPGNYPVYCCPMCGSTSQVSTKDNKHWGCGYCGCKWHYAKVEQERP